MGHAHALQTAVSIGATVLGTLFGRRGLGPATTAAKPGYAGATSIVQLAHRRALNGILDRH